MWTPPIPGVQASEVGSAGGRSRLSPGGGGFHGSDGGMEPVCGGCSPLGPGDDGDGPEDGSGDDGEDGEDGEEVGGAEE